MPVVPLLETELVVPVSLVMFVAAVMRDSDLRGTAGVASSGGVWGELGERTCGVAGCSSCLLSVLRYSGVGRRLRVEFVAGVGAAVPLPFIDSEPVFESWDFVLECFSTSFESLLPIDST